MLPYAVFLLLLWVGADCSRGFAFEGKIQAVTHHSGTTKGLLYTATTNAIRVEITDTNFPNAIDVMDFNSGQMTLIQPMNRTFVRFTPGAPHAPTPPPHAFHPNAEARLQPPAMPAGMGPTNAPGMPGMPMPPGGLPPGFGPQQQSANAIAAPPGAPSMPAMPMPPSGLPPGIGPQAHADPAGAGAMPGMANMPPMPMVPVGGGLEVRATGETTNLFNYPCQRYEIRQNEQVMEIWATDQLLPFQPYLGMEPHPFAPPTIEEQWGRLLSAKKLFPLSAILRLDGGVERYRFEVQSIEPKQLTAADLRGFQPPEGYTEMQPRPF